MEITQYTTTKKTTACNRIPTYLVIHYTASITSKNGTAKKIADGFRNSSREASADFIVDDANIIQYNPDPTKRYAWSVGGAKYDKMSTSIGGRLYGIAKNSNCVNIEMCSSKENTKSLRAEDTDWYFTDAVMDNTIELAKHLMQLYNITIDRVIMHHEITGKVCSSPFCVDESHLVYWQDFKNRLDGKEIETHEENTSLIQRGIEEAIKFINGTATFDLRTAELSRVKSAVLQRAMNLDYHSGLKVDGLFGKLSVKALASHYVEVGEKQYMVTALEILLYLNGLDPNGVETKGKYGNGVVSASGDKFNDNGHRTTASEFLQLIK